MSRRYPHTRFVTFAVVVGCALLVLTARLAWVQVFSHDHWQKVYEDQSRQKVEVAARRGTVFDRNGHPLAMSEHRYRVGVTKPEKWLEPTSLTWLAGALGISERQVRGRLKNRSGHVVVHKTDLDPVARMQLAAQPTVTLDRLDDRKYPVSGLATRLLGRVAASGHGDAGIEVLFDDRLAGSPGTEMQFYDALRQGTLQRQPIEPPRDGWDVLLTLDHRLQMILEEELETARVAAGSSEAWGMIVEPYTGEVLALAEVPVLSSRDRKSYAADRWRTRSATDLFEPGSTFKLFTVASMLSRGVCDTSTVYDAEGNPNQRRNRVDLGGFTFQDVHPVGRVSLRHAFAVSSNIWMGKAVSLLRRDEFHEDIARAGFGSRTHSGWPAETAGLLHNPAKWSDRSQPTMAIGQEVGVSLFQLTMAYAALVSDGHLRSPQFVSRWRDDQGTLHDPESNILRRNVVPASVPPVLRALCEGVVANDYGSGTAARVDGLRIAGKTGTAQIPGPNGYRSDAFMASFVGFVPADRPRLLAVLVLQEAKGAMRWGGHSAAPCFSRIVEKAMACTTWLDDAAQGLRPAPGPVSLPLPDLRGHDAGELAKIAQAAAWNAYPPAPDAHARVIGQMPPAGTPVRPGARVQVAWRGGVR